MHYKCSYHPGGLYNETNMTEKENDFTVEQRPYTKIRVLLEYSATDIKNDFDKVYHIISNCFTMVSSI